MLNKIKFYWEYVQDILDLNGDVVMLIFTGIILYRLVAVVFGQQPINANEAAVYGSAVVAFAYSNKKPPTL